MPETDANFEHFDTVFRSEQHYLFGICYRMLGSTADADDLVQETFLRAMDRGPKDTQRPWRPWLTRVAINLSRDSLRERQRRPYVGPWLPSPLETDPLKEFMDTEVHAYEPQCTQGRYELLESVSLAFLTALEALNPLQRAVLLLRDVFGYDGRETAEALEINEANVRQTLGRARQRMEVYDAARVGIDQHHRDQLLSKLGRFMEGVVTKDVSAIEALLAENVRTVNDSAGEFFAARVPVIGRNKVARFHTGLIQKEMPLTEIRIINGLPAIVGEIANAPEGYASRFVTTSWLDRHGQVASISTYVAVEKLIGIRRVDPEAALSAFQ